MPDMGNIRIKDENMNKTTIITNVQTHLFELQDLKYRDFHAKLMPTVNKEKIIGVRTPALRAFAKSYGKTDEAKEYLQILPHQYYEENNLHGLLIEQIKEPGLYVGYNCNFTHEFSSGNFYIISILISESDFQ